MTAMNDSAVMLPFLLQVILLVVAAAAIGYAVAWRVGTSAGARARSEQAKALEEARKEREALADELAQVRGKLSALSSEAERTRTLAASFRRRADELEASLRDAVARASANVDRRAMPPAA